MRGLLALNVTVAAGAMVIVNTVIFMKAGFGLGDREVAWTLAAYGFDSMAAALALQRLLEGVATDRAAMLAGAALLVGAYCSVPWCRPRRRCCRSGRCSAWATAWC